MTANNMSLADRIAAAKAGAATPAGAVVAGGAGVAVGGGVVADQTVVTPATTTVVPGTLAAAAAAAAAAGGVATPGAAAPVGGGNRLEMVRAALKTASVTGGRNDLPIGVGTFLLKSGKLFVTQGQLNISTFSLLCLQGIKDGVGNVFGAEGYSGPIPGETYDESMFQNFEPKRIAQTIANNLRAVTACMGWTEEQVKTFKSTPAGEGILFELMKGMMCIDMESGAPTEQPCCFSNQVVVQMTRRAKVVEQKDKVTKEFKYDKDGNKLTDTYINTFWDKKIPLSNVLEMIGEPATIESFGTAEDYLAAVKNETDMSGIA